MDVARGIQLESDHQYANDSIAGADLLAVEALGIYQTATVAGTIMTAQGTNQDEDQFALGTLSADNTVELDMAEIM